MPLPRFRARRNVSSLPGGYRRLQLVRERRDQLLREEKWIGARAVHIQQGGNPDSQGINNTASRLRRCVEFLGAWNGREFLHPTFQFHPDTGRLMPEIKTLLAVLPQDRSGWWRLVAVSAPWSIK